MRLSEGILLIAEPFLNDPNFDRSVVLLCSYNQEGAFGLVLNQRTDLLLNDVLEETIYPDVPLFLGGPVEKNTLHFIHRRPDLLQGGLDIGYGLYWGGDFEALKRLLNHQLITTDDVRFFIGYSGWSAGQLDDELQEKSWFLSATSARSLFETEPENLWREVLRAKGGKYKSIAHYPTDPSLN